MVIPLLFLPFSSNLPEAPGTRHGGEIEHAGEKNEQATMPTFIRGGFAGVPCVQGDRTYCAPDASTYLPYLPYLVPPTSSWLIDVRTVL